MAETWTTQRILLWTADFFSKRGIDAPRLSAELLLAHVLQCDRVRLYVDLDRPLDDSERTAYRQLIERRAAGESTWYLVGYRNFHGHRFAVDSRVLVPRPETERLVERILELLPGDSPREALDLCTGSGCIALSLAAERPAMAMTAVDLSSGALEVARQNGQTLGLADRVTWLEGDLDHPLSGSGRAFDLLVSNPPYIATSALADLPPEVRCEPRAALDGGETGLDLIRRIVDAAPRLLKPGGLLALEIGDDQGAATLEHLTRAGLENPRIEPDLAGRDRMAFATRA